MINKEFNENVTYYIILDNIILLLLYQIKYNKKKILDKIQ